MGKYGWFWAKLPVPLNEVVVRSGSTLFNHQKAECIENEVPGSKGGFTAQNSFRAVNDSVYCTEL